jgi:hypothetical protein
MARTPSSGTGVGPPVTNSRRPTKALVETARHTAATSSSAAGKLCLP